MARHTSLPMRSAKAKGPMGWLAPSFIASSMSSALATPSANMATASFIIGISILFTTKPGASSTSTGFLPTCSANWNILSLVSCDVAIPFITSTSFIKGTGLKKCIPIILSGLLVAPAISVIDKEEVFVAKIASGLHILSNSAKSSFFR
ncbi:hypothetical protein SDC9_209243 [bioreactor metagenome]|uniref:Uncharacterized protein n=1 Tax=bioreactor metagenome TaxID=1076179 RepID=A0A645JCQ7_9ZZZZ